MGITGFHKWIETEYPNIYHDINTTNYLYHHLYIDLNYLLHLCHYNSNDEIHLLNKMSIVILDICAKVQPICTVNLYCDGTSPYAKMILQRERRSTNTFKQDEDTYRTNLNFTPGTIFIKDISNKLSKCINIIKEQYNVKINIDSIAPGEAEIKIKNKLLKLYNINKNHNHLLVTNDADVVLILCSDESYSKTNILLHNKVLSIDKLIKYHFKKYTNNSVINNLDFVFLNLFLGNDYIPKIKELSPKKIWESYKLNIDKHKYLIKINKVNNINIFDINKNFLLDILSDCVSKIGKIKIIKNNTKYNNEIYINYYEGILWTIDMYNIGCCMNYTYMCKSKNPIDILNFIIFIDGNKDINKYNNKISYPIPSILCAILLLPKNANELIDKKYIKFINDDEIKKIYEDNFKITEEFIELSLNKFIKYEEKL